MKPRDSKEPTHLSSRSIRQVVRNESLFHPLTIYPAALGILSGLAATLYGMPILYAGMGGLFALGATTSIINYFFRDEVISRKYLAKVTQDLEERQKKVLETLEQELRQCITIPGAGHYAAQGGEQFARIEQKYRRLTQLLGKKFSPTELTYGAYLGAADQLHLGLLDNLMKIVSLLQGAASVDPQYILERKKELQSLQEVTEADEREFEALEKRLTLREDQLQQVNTLLTENEESMTIMDTTIAKIADLNTEKKLSKSDMKSAMKYLQEIADRTRYYDQ